MKNQKSEIRNQKDGILCHSRESGNPSRWSHFWIPDQVRNDGVRITPNRNGFTIVELLVAAGLFLVMLAVVTGAFVRGLAAEQATLRLLAANDNANALIEQLSREIRVGTDFSTVGESELRFKNSAGVDVAYRRNGSAVEKRNGDGDFARVSASNVNIAYARFLLRGEAPAPDRNQPLITIALGIAATGKGTEGITTHIQTSVSPRLLDN